MVILDIADTLVGPFRNGSDAHIYAAKHHPGDEHLVRGLASPDNASGKLAVVRHREYGHQYAITGVESIGENYARLVFGDPETGEENGATTELNSLTFNFWEIVGAI